MKFKTVYETIIETRTGRPSDEEKMLIGELCMKYDTSNQIPRSRKYISIINDILDQINTCDDEDRRSLLGSAKNRVSKCLKEYRNKSYYHYMDLIEPGVNKFIDKYYGVRPDDDVFVCIYLIFLRDLHSVKYDSGLGFVVIMFTAILMTDIGCYYVGTKFGKHKLAPVISPNKTIEGSIGGIISAIIGAVIISFFIGFEWYYAIIFGLICTVFAQIGDLCESLIKRDAGVKDSGDSLPGHGGFLDRTDSFIFTIPVVYYVCKYFIFSNQIINDFTNLIKGLF